MKEDINANNKCGKLLKKETICLAKDVRLRKELWGGIVFRRDNGTVVDVDQDAFTLLSLLEEKHAVKVEDLLAVFSGKDKGKKSAVKHRNDTVAVLQQLFDLGIVKVCRLQEAAPAEHAIYDTVGKPAAKPENSPGLTPSPQRQNDNCSLSAPETVHWAITFRCLQDCPDCYARRYREQGFDELQTDKALQVVKNLAGWGVFQLALGGGEPLLRPDLPLITRAAKDSGLAVHITTGLIEDFDFELLEQLAPSIESLHIGVKRDRLLNQPRQEMAHLQQIVHVAQTLGLATGANLILCNTVMKNFGEIIEDLVKAGFKRIILLRYKPPSDVNLWLAETPPPEAFINFETILQETVKLYPHIEFRLDCALSFLQRNLSPGEALSAGLRGCVAGSRVMALAADGSIYPCSQLMSPRFKAGDILSEDFRSFWNAKPMKKYRYFREKRSFRETYCGICQARKQCGGCRVFAHDALGEDPGCRKPLFPPVQQLGREGRKAALRAYFEKHFSISVGEYMDYFQVGQKKAVKELKNTSWLMQEKAESSGRKKADTYIRTDAYLLEEIQEVIGFTSGGFPYATLEEISRWVNEPEDLHDYPKWLLSRQQD